MANRCLPNVYCGATAQDDLGNDYSAEFSGTMKPSYQANESCAILKDDPETSLNGRKNPWTNFLSKAKSFDVPGMPDIVRGDVVIQQP